MAYPFLPDFHAAVMVKLGGLKLRGAFLYTGLPLCLSLVALLFTFSRRVTGSTLGSLFAVALVFGTGGMGGWHLWARDGWGSALYQDVIQNDTSGDGKAVWFAFLPHVVLPQRGANFAYPMALVVLTLVWGAGEWGTGRRGGPVGDAPPTTPERASLLLAAAVLASALPLVQAHSFLALAVIIGTVFVLDAHKWTASPALALGWARAGAAAAVLALPQLRQFSSRVTAGAGGKFTQRGWWFVNHDSGRTGGVLGFFSFWWLNLGPALPLMLLALGALAAETLLARALVERALAKPGVSPETLARACGYVEECDWVEAPAQGAGGGGAASLAAGFGRVAAAPGSAARAAEGAAPPTPVGTTTGEASPQPPPGVPVAVAYAAPPAAGAAGAPPTGDEPSFSELLWGAAKASVKADTGGAVDLEVLLTPERYASRWLDVTGGRLFFLNAASLTGRGFDALKLAAGAFAVFLLGNYVMFQPWDRDNCKMFYVGLFVNAAVVGALLAAPFEALAAAALGAAPCDAGPGFARVLAALGCGDKAAYATAVCAAGGGENLALAAALFEDAERVDATARPAPAAKASDDTAPRPNRPLRAERVGAVATVSLLGALGAAVALFFLTLSGFMMIAREFKLYHQLMDRDQFEVRSPSTPPPPPHPSSQNGALRPPPPLPYTRTHTHTHTQQMAEFILAKVPPKAVMVHRDVHITPAGCLTGRISLIAYNGWMWSHGYNYGERENDRAYVLDNALKDSNPEAYNRLRRWGVRFVLGENIARHHRPSRVAWEEAAAAAAASKREGEVAPYEEDLYLDGQLKRVKTVGRYELFEVLGYGL
jgi:hypothetical protein